MGRCKSQNAHTNVIGDATLLDILMNNLPDTIYFKDKEGRFIKVNSHQAEMLGVPNTKDAIGRTDFDFFPESFSRVARNDELTIMSSGEAIRSKLERLVDKEGKVKWFSATKAPIPDENGKSIGIVGLSRDVTERQEMETSMEELNSLRELLLDIITHDLKNPVGVIQNVSEMALEEDPENDFLQLIHSTSQSLIQVLQNTTLLSQAAMGETIPMEKLDLVKIIDESVDEFSLSLKQANLDIELDLPESFPVEANILITEIFKNFLSNAIKYARDGKLIRITLENDSQSVMVKVLDQGTTIPKADREKVFQRHHQLDAESKRGRGLGLAIVKRIAIAHNGESWVEPNIPQGNVFCLRLPL